MDRFRENIDDLLADNHSGSGKLLESLVGAIGELVSGQEEECSVDAGLLREQLSGIIREKPHFLVLHHFINELLRVTGRERSLPCSQVRAFIDRYRKRWGKAEALIASYLEQAVSLNGKTVLLHSNSKTVCSMFGGQGLTGSGIRIIQTESRPVNEGRLQAEYLAKLGFEVTLVTDASVTRSARKADFALLGADAVYPGTFINKSGSYSIALACREFGKDCLVVCDSRKLWLNQAGGSTFDASFGEPAPPEEVWQGAPDNLEIENHYFEQIPNSLVTSFIFEDRIVAGAKIGELIHHR